MKTFNFIAIATIVLASVFTFTSCEKDNDSFNGGSNNESLFKQKTDNTNSQKEDSTTTKSKGDNPFANLDGTWEATDAQGTKITVKLTDKKVIPATSANAAILEYNSRVEFTATILIGDKTYDAKFLDYLIGVGGEEETPICLIEIDKNAVSASAFNAKVLSNGVTTPSVTFNKVN